MKAFEEFIKKYRIVSISVAFIISLAASAFIQSLVNDILLPLLRPILSPESLVWEEMTFAVGTVNLRIGSFLSAFLNLSITLAILYLVIDRILKWEPKS